MTSSEWSARLVVSTAVAVAVIVNAVQFRALELETTEIYEALHVKEEHDLLSLVEGNLDTTQERFLLTVQLRELAPGAALTMPPGAGLSSEQLIGLGRLAAVRSAPYDPGVPADVAAELDRAAAATGEDDVLGPYAIVVEDGEVEELLVLRGPERAYVVDRRVLGPLSIEEGA